MDYLFSEDANQFEIDTAREHLDPAEWNQGMRQRFGAGIKDVEYGKGTSNARYYKLYDEEELFKRSQTTQQNKISTLARAKQAVGVGTALGAATYAAKKGTEYVTENGLTLPGTDYVGPGNKINIDAPRHETDAVAKEHDVAYETAQQNAQSRDEFESHISAADNDAIAQFQDAYNANGDWQSKVAEYGLRAKSGVETAIGKVIYPPYQENTDNDTEEQMPPPTKKQKKTGAEDAAAEAPPKGTTQKNWGAIRKINEHNRFWKEAHKVASRVEQENQPGENTATDATMSEEQRAGNGAESQSAMDTSDPGATNPATSRAGGSGGGAPTGGGAGGSSRPARAPMTQGTVRTFSHVYTARTWGKNWVYDATTPEVVDTSFRHTDKHVYTSLNWLPVDVLGFYLTGAEFRDLPMHAIIKKVSCEVEVLGITSSFETGATVTSTASTHFYADAAIAVGINSKIPCKAYVPSFTAGTVIQASVNNITDVHFNVWNTNMVTADNDILYASNTLTQNSPMYLELGWRDIESINDQATVQQRFVHTPPVLDRMITKVNAHELIGKTIINYTYVPKDGTINRPMCGKPMANNDVAYHVGKCNFVHNVINNVNNIDVATESTTQMIPWTGLMSATNNLTQNHEGQYMGLNNLSQEEDIYKNQLIEKAAGRGDFTATAFDVTHMQPCVCFGLMPVYANSPDSFNDNPINCGMTFRVRTHIVIEQPSVHTNYYENARILPHLSNYVHIFGTAFNGNVGSNGNNAVLSYNKWPFRNFNYTTLPATESKKGEDVNKDSGLLHKKVRSSFSIVTRSHGKKGKVFKEGVK
ncbi:MAG: structural protein [Corparats virus 3]|nr:MAG: structural protein [Corparats virus 3]